MKNLKNITFNFKEMLLILYLYFFLFVFSKEDEICFTICKPINSNFGKCFTDSDCLKIHKNLRCKYKYFYKASIYKHCIFEK